MSAIRSVIRGTGGYLPERVMTNAEMSTIVETSDEWIHERTGIRQRHIAADGELTSDLATKAAQSILRDASIAADDVDLIVLATTTPDKTFPATATAVQANLGTGPGAAFDVQAVCSGFLFALATADSMLKTGLFKTALVIGAETFTRILDWSDRGTCVLFGDGAGGVSGAPDEFAGLLQPVEIGREVGGAGVVGGGVGPADLFLGDLAALAAKLEIAEERVGRPDRHGGDVGQVIGIDEDVARGAHGGVARHHVDHHQVTH